MNSPEAQIETQLSAALDRAGGTYRRALALLQSSFPEQPETGSDITSTLARLQPVLQQVQQLEGSLLPLRQQWNRLQQQPGAELRRSLQGHAQLLEGLIHCMNAIEQKLQQKRQTMTPAVDACLRHQQMQRAYQSVSQT